MWWRKSIAARVAEVIEKRVEAAQKAHDEACKLIEERAEKDKEDNAAYMVKSVLEGK